MIWFCWFQKMIFWYWRFITWKLMKLLFLHSVLKSKSCFICCFWLQILINSLDQILSVSIWIFLKITWFYMSCLFSFPNRQFEWRLLRRFSLHFHFKWMLRQKFQWGFQRLVTKVIVNCLFKVIVLIYHNSRRTIFIYFSLY